MKPFVFDNTAEILDQERQVITWFRDNPPKNVKQLIKRVKSIYNQVPDFIQNSMCSVLLSPKTKDPMKALKQYIYEMDSVPKLVAGLIKEGNHGMVIYNHAFYGFNLITSPRWLNKKLDTRWTEEQEDEILNEVLSAWMTSNCIRYFKGKVVLFEEFGFSGVARLMEFEMCAEEWEQVKSRKVSEELKLLMSTGNDS